jgi:Uma2 family endonuclease
MVAHVVVKKDSHEIIATGVSFEEYMEKYAGDFCELVEGNVIKKPPIHERHDELSRYLSVLFGAYFAVKPIGIIRRAPFVMRALPELPKREPDLQIILKTNPKQPKPTLMDGAADICIEIVSPGSEDTDRGEKFIEYEKGGVGEYWIFDHRRKEALFYRLNEEGVYIPQYADDDGNYRTPILPGFALHVPTLWQSPLPDLFSVADAVKAMLK